MEEEEEEKVVVEKEEDGQKWRTCILNKLLRKKEREERESRYHWRAREIGGEIAFSSRLHFFSLLSFGSVTKRG